MTPKVCNINTAILNKENGDITSTACASLTMKPRGKEHTRTYAQTGKNLLQIWISI